MGSDSFQGFRYRHAKLAIRLQESPGTGTSGAFVAGSPLEVRVRDSLDLEAAFLDLFWEGGREYEGEKGEEKDGLE